MPPCEQILYVGDEIVTFRWHDETMVPGVLQAQIYGFCVTPDKRVILVRDSGEDRFTLPGGQIEPGESAEDALRREVREEAQVQIHDIALLGSLEVAIRCLVDAEVKQHQQQLRFICRVDYVREFIPNFGGFETCERLLVPPSMLPSYIDWMGQFTGKTQFEAFIHKLENIIW